MPRNSVLLVEAVDDRGSKGTRQGEFQVEEHGLFSAWKCTHDAEELIRSWPVAMEAVQKLVGSTIDNLPSMGSYLVEKIEVNIGIEAGLKFALVAKADASVSITFKRVP